MRSARQRNKSDEYSHPEDQLGSSQKRTADMISPRTASGHKFISAAPSVCASWQKISPSGDYLRFAALIAGAVRPSAGDGSDRALKKPAHRASPRWIFTFCRVISTGKSC
ncbi:hypothetical protein ACLB1M_30735 [Escherichia coli]